ncbi:MAG: FAD-dependent pyridine nucleotide-disulfide oxidoreductase [Acidobacteriales bacterium]|nr:FAD-dependent pyridine nucleotide-disulfide oxidoreductase [Terriglobales bacterium]
MLKQHAPRLTPEQYEQNFSDINPPLTRSQALEEGSRCLFCYDAPCIKACPTGIDVPQFIRQIGTGNVTGAAKTILNANILGHSCARVCPTSVLCEGACVLNMEHKRPIDIGKLQRYAVDHVMDTLQLFTPPANNGRKVALIGGGPASLSCATELRRHGYATTIFDANPDPGGLDTYGIAAYKLRAEDAVREFGLVRRLGVEIRSNVEVTSAKLAELEREYDAIFIGIGLGGTDDLQIPGEELEGCCDALTFIRNTKEQPFDKVSVGNRIAVIGGGNTAIDVVTAARRLGAEEIYMIYRRGEAEASAFEYEIELAKKDSITFVWQSVPTRILGRDKVESLECVKTMLGPPDASGRRSPKNISGSEFRLDVDMVIKALGQKRKTDFLQSISGLKLEKGCVQVQPATMQTANPKYFAGGDCVNGGGEVVDAVAHGKTAAAGIHQVLSATARRTHA